MSNKLATNLKTAVAALALATVTATAAGAVTLQEVKDRGYVRVAVANEIPYGYTDPSGTAMGAGPDVAKAVLENMGVDPENIQWVVTSFSSLIPGLQANRFDMTAAEMAIRPERCQKVDYSTPNSTYGEGLLVPQDNPDKLSSYSDFKEGDKKVAVMAGADQLQMLQKLGVPQDNIVTIASNSDAISTVSTGRAAAYAATGLTAAELANKGKGVQVVDQFEDPMIDGKEVRSWGGFTFNKDSGDFREAFNKELEAYKKTDEWKKTLSKYGFTSHDIEQSSAKTTEELCSAE